MKTQRSKRFFPVAVCPERDPSPVSLSHTTQLTLGHRRKSITTMGNEDEARRKLLKPKVTHEEALSILTDFYIPDGFGGDVKTEELPRCEVITQLDSYDDINFLVKIDGEKALLKIHNGVESEQYIAAHARKRARTEDAADVNDTTSATSVIDLHTAIYEHLSAPKYNLTTGRSIPVKNSFHSSNEEDDNDDSVCIRDLSVISEDHSPQQLVVRLLTWVHGDPLSSVQWCSIETLVDAGCYLGRMSHALDELGTSNKNALEASKHYHAWDGRHAADIDKFISHIDDDDRRKLITSIIESFKKDIIDSGEGEKFRMGMNHADYNDANIIVKNDGTGIKVSGVIDFGDTVHR